MAHFGRNLTRAANSLVAYLLGITPIDPLAHDLVFERFLSEERGVAPDIDIDFQADRREEVIQYVYQRYGPEHTAMACTLVTFRARSAVRDVGKALGISDFGEDAGLVKIDLLGLRMLSAIVEALEIIEETTGEAPDLDHLPFDDPAVYDLICAGDTIGVFQVESRAQAQMLPQLKPRTFEDLIVEISLVRPGPIQGDMVHPYLRRRQGRQPVTYLHPLLKPALAETLGVIIFQEQVLKVARDLAGFTPGQAELLRRALGKKRAGEEVERFRDAFIRGAEARGVATLVAEKVFGQLKAFGGYSFPKSHAASFAVLVGLVPDA